MVGHITQRELLAAIELRAVREQGNITRGDHGAITGRVGGAGMSAPNNARQGKPARERVIGIHHKGAGKPLGFLRGRKPA